MKLRNSQLMLVSPPYRQFSSRHFSAVACLRIWQSITKPLEIAMHDSLWVPLSRLLRKWRP